MLTRRELNRALLARQSLLERSSMSIPEVVEQVGGLQTQYAPSGYVGLWSRSADFRRDALTAALEDRSVIQATLMRVTIHVVSRREYWSYALGVREARRTLWRPGDRPFDDGGRGRAGRGRRADARGAGGRAAHGEGARRASRRASSGRSACGSISSASRRRGPGSTGAPTGWASPRTWVGPVDSTEAEGRVHLVRAYLRAFGPAQWRDIASWSGITASAAKEAGASMALRRFRDEDGRELVDVPDGPLPDPDTPAPVRFLPHWDANLLVHARRTGVLPEAYRQRVFSTKNPFSVGTYLVDGAVAGAWSLRDGRIVLDPFEQLSARDRGAVEDEREALEAFHA